MDYGHKYADERLKTLEKKLKKEYSKAAAEAHKKARMYLDGFSEYDKILAEKVKSGEMLKADYLKWRKDTLFYGNQWLDTTKMLSESFINAGTIAADMISDTSLDAFAMNFNFGTYEVEKLSKLNTSFTLYDKETVRRLIEEEPDLLPVKKLKKKFTSSKAMRWHKSKLQSVATQSILQGDSIPTIAERLAKETANSDLNSAVRNARTMMTSAENGGRVESYKRAQKLGIKMKKEWLATNDNRTRHTHEEINGDQVDIDDTFDNGLRYPGDPEGEPDEVYNCRCTLVGALEGIDYDTDLEPTSVGSFEDWQNEH